MRINIAIPEASVKAPVLNGALEAVTRLNEDLIRTGVSPTSDQLIDRGAKWRPEKPGEEHFDHGGLIASRGHGDCDDWAPLHAATLRVTGEDRGARAIVKKSGPKRWHAIVQRSDGTIDDPSLEAGMPGPARAVGVCGAWVPRMYDPSHEVGGSFVATPHLALRPLADRQGQVEAWQARADLPWHYAPGSSPTDVAMASLHQSPVSDQAIVGAVRGLYRLGAANGIESTMLERLSAIADACNGLDWDELSEVYGTEHANAAAAVVGSFFGKAFKKLGKLAKGAVGPALSLLPGGSLAAAAFNAASPALKKAVLQRKHLPPGARAPLAVSPLRAPSSSPIMSPHVPALAYGDLANMLHRAYTTRAVDTPGAAWPPRG